MTENLTQAYNNAIVKSQASSQDSALVSIIIPAYNTAQYIHRAIGSSIRQTHKNIEILIIDDGSTDETLRVAEYFAGTDSRIRVLTQKNAGVSAARNHGINEAKGKYICFLDADDWLEDNAIELLLDAQNEHPDKMICADYYLNVEVEGSTLLRNGSIGKMTPSRTLNMRDVAETYCYLQKPDVFHVLHAKLFRTPFSARFPEGLMNGEDGVFFIRYFIESGEKIYYLNKTAANILRREGSVTRSKYKREFFDHVAESYKIMTDLVDDEESKRLILINRNRFMYSIFREAVKQGVSREEIKHMKSAMRPTAQLTLKFREKQIQSKFRLFLAVFAPVWVYKAVTFTYDFLSGLKKQKPSHKEVITNWQDFPKAPGINL